MKNVFLLILSFFTVSAWSQIVSIPDTNFKACLLEQLYLNTNNDDEIQESEALYFSRIDCSNRSISDLTGVEAFENLIELNLEGNSLTSLDVDINVRLRELNCSNNNLNSLDVSRYVELRELNCSNNNLDSIDLTYNPELYDINVDSNKLTSLDFSNNSPAFVHCSNNQLTSLDLGTVGIKSVEDLWCDHNNLTSLDLTDLYDLSTLVCNDNKITYLDFRDVWYLRYLDCSNNNLVTLGLGGTGVQTINCSGNSDLISLDASTGNNSFLSLIASNNPSLTCINIDQGFTPLSNWEKDSTATYAYDDCAAIHPVVYIPDENFKDYLLEKRDINTNADGEIQVSEAIVTKTIAVSAYVSDLTGIEAFTTLTSLICHINELTSLDVSNNKALNYLDCGENKLTYLNVSNGNNRNFSFMYAAGNEDLSCINIDSGFTPTPTMFPDWEKGWTKDDDAIYTDDGCGVTGVDDETFTFGNKLELYPNPVNEFVQLKFDQAIYGVIKIQVYNNYGRIMIERESVLSHDILSSLDVSELTSGNYLMKITSANDMITHSFIKE